MIGSAMTPQVRPSLPMLYLPISIFTLFCSFCYVPIFIDACQILEFTEMSKVMTEVDPKMLARCYKWLLDRRDGYVVSENERRKSQVAQKTLRR